MNFDNADNWDHVPELKGKPVSWIKVDNVDFPYVAKVGGADWRLRINNFPDAPLYTLIIDTREIIHVNDWPPYWQKSL